MLYFRTISVSPPNSIPFTFFTMPITDLANTLHAKFGVNLGIYGSSANRYLDLTHHNCHDLDLVVSGDGGEAAIQFLLDQLPKQAQIAPRDIYDNKLKIGIQYHWQSDENKISLVFYSGNPPGPLFDDVAHSLIVWLPGDRVQSRAEDVGLSKYLATHHLLYYPPNHLPQKMIWRAAFRVCAGWKFIHQTPAQRMQFIPKEQGDSTYTIGKEINDVFKNHQPSASINQYYTVIDALASGLPDDAKSRIQAVTHTRLLDLVNCQDFIPARDDLIRFLVGAIDACDNQTYKPDLNRQLNQLIKWNPLGAKISPGQRVLTNIRSLDAITESTISTLIIPLLSKQPPEFQSDWISKHLDNIDFDSLRLLWNETPDAMAGGMTKYLLEGGTQQQYRSTLSVAPSDKIHFVSKQLLDLISSPPTRATSNILRFAGIQLLNASPNSDSIKAVLNLWMSSTHLSPADRALIIPKLATVITVSDWAPNLHQPNGVTTLFEVLPNDWVYQTLTMCPDTQWPIEALVPYLPPPGQLSLEMVKTLFEKLIGIHQSDATQWLAQAVRQSPDLITLAGPRQEGIIRQFFDSPDRSDTLLVSVLNAPKVCISTELFDAVSKRISENPTILPIETESQWGELMIKVVSQNLPWSDTTVEQSQQVQTRILTFMASIDSIPQDIQSAVFQWGTIQSIFKWSIDTNLISKFSRLTFQKLVTALKPTDPYDWHQAVLKATQYTELDAVAHLLRLPKHTLQQVLPQVETLGVAHKMAIANAMINQKSEINEWQFDLFNTVLRKINDLPKFVHTNANTIAKFLSKNGQKWQGPLRDTVLIEIKLVRVKAAHKVFLQDLDTYSTNNLPSKKIADQFNQFSNDVKSDIAIFPEFAYQLLQLSFKSPIRLPKLPDSIWDRLSERDWATLLSDTHTTQLATVPSSKIPIFFPIKSTQPTWVYAILKGQGKALSVIVNKVQKAEIQQSDASVWGAAWDEHLKQTNPLPLGVDKTGSTFYRGITGSHRDVAFSVIDAILSGKAPDCLSILSTDSASVDARTLALTDCVIRTVLKNMMVKQIPPTDAFALIFNMKSQVAKLNKNALINLTQPIDLITTDTKPTYLMTIIDSVLNGDGKTEDKFPIVETWLILLINTITNSDNWKTCPWTIGNIVYLHAVIGELNLPDSHLTQILNAEAKHIFDNPKPPSEYGFTPEIFEYFIQASAKLIQDGMAEQALTNLYTCFDLTDPTVQAQYRPFCNALYYLPNTINPVRLLLNQGLLLTNESWNPGPIELVIVYAHFDLLSQFFRQDEIKTKITADFLFQIIRNNIGSGEEFIKTKLDDIVTIRRFNAKLHVVDHIRAGFLNQVVRENWSKSNTPSDHQMLSPMPDHESPTNPL